MKIDTSSAWWQVTLVVFSAALAVFGTLSFNWATNAKREITLFSNTARSDLNGPGIWRDSKTHQISIHEYVIKNTGNAPLDRFRLRLAPQGGDGAYDSANPQHLQFAGISAGQAIPNDVKIFRDANAVMIDIESLRPSEEVNFTITNDGVADEYSPSVLPSSIALLQSTNPDWKPVSFDQLPLSARLFVFFCVILMSGVWIYAFWLATVFLKRKILKNE